MSIPSEQEFGVPCRDCQAGQLHRRYLTYFAWLGEELITVPDFPSWVCDVCGRREYDPMAITQLTTILSPHAGTTPRRKRRPGKRMSPRRKSSRTNPGVE